MIDRGVITLVVLSLAVRPVLADISVSVDKLDATDGIPMPPPTLVGVDVAIDVTDADAFAGIGVNAVTGNGAQFEFARDPNGVVIGSAPGAENRFVTFFSRPRPRDANGRFGVGAYVNTGNRYCAGPASIFIDTQVNAVGFPTGYEAGRDGYVLRIALDLRQVVDPAFQVDSDNIVVSTTRLPDAFALLETHCGEFEIGGAVASQFGDYVYFWFGIYGVPEPATVAGLLIAAGAVVRRR